MNAPTVTDNLLSLAAKDLQPGDMIRGRGKVKMVAVSDEAVLVWYSTPKQGKFFPETILEVYR